MATPVEQLALLSITIGAGVLVANELSRKDCYGLCLADCYAFGGTPEQCEGACSRACKYPLPTPLPVPPRPTPTPPPDPGPPEVATSAALTPQHVCAIDLQWEYLLLVLPGIPWVKVPVWTNTPTRPNHLALWGQGSITGCSGFSMDQIVAQAARRRILVELLDGCGPRAFGLMFVPAICKVTPTPTPTPPPPPLPPPPPPSVWHGVPPYYPDPARAIAAINQVFEPLGIAEIMRCIAQCESKLDPGAWNINLGHSAAGCCYGLFQIHELHESGLLNAGIIASWDDLADPLVNSRAALWLYNQAGFSAWSCVSACGV